MNHEGEYTIGQWFEAKMQLLDKDSLYSILVEQGIDGNSPFHLISEKRRDLLLAAGYFEMLMQVSEQSEIKDSDGNWSHSEGGKTISEVDRKRWKAIYCRLRRKWGLDVLLQPSVRFESRGFRTWRKI